MIENCGGFKAGPAIACCRCDDCLRDVASAAIRMNEDQLKMVFQRICKLLNIHTVQISSPDSITTMRLNESDETPQPNS